MRARTRLSAIRYVALISFFSFLLTINASMPAQAATDSVEGTLLAHHVSAMAVGRSAAGIAHRISGKRTGTAHPRGLSISDRIKLQTMFGRMHPTLPLTPIGRTYVTHPIKVAPSSAVSLRVALRPNAAVNIIAHDVGTQTTSPVDEPSVASDGANVLQTWNWYSGISIDGGNNWTYYDPSTLFSNDYGGWCCDSVTMYEGSRQLFLWNLLYQPNANGGAFRLAVANGGNDLATATFHSWDLTPQQTGGNVGDWYDFPSIAVSNNYAYLQANVFTSANQYSKTQVLRFALNDLAGTGSLSYSYLTADGVATVAFSNGATSTMYFAGHLSNSTLRVFHWDDGANTYGWDDVNHVSYPAAGRGGYNCPRTGGSSSSNWCARSDDRVLSGWVSRGIIAFSWNAAQGQWGFSGSAPYPYTDIVRINEVTKLRIDDPVVWNSSYAFQYMSFYPNFNGGIGGTYMVGGGPLYETPGVNIWDTQGRDFVNYAQSDQDTVAAGDYLTTRPLGNNWVGTGYTLLSDGTHPYNVIFGR